MPKSLRLHVYNSFTFWDSQDFFDLPLELKKLFQFELEQYRYLRRKNPLIQLPPQTVYNAARRAFPTGLLPAFVVACEKLGLHVEIVDRREGKIENPDFSNIDFLRFYQKEALEAFIKGVKGLDGRGVVQMFTGTGKTYFAPALHLIFRKAPMLVITPKVDIVRQFLALFEELIPDANVATLTGFLKVGDYKTASVVLATPNSVWSSFTADDYKRFRVLIIDECHRVGIKTQLFQIALKLTNAYYRLGLSATPIREGGDHIAVFSAIGPILYVYDHKEAVADGFNIPAQVVFVEPNYPLGFGISARHISGDNFSALYDELIVKNSSRNDLAVKIAVDLFRRGQQVLVLCERVEHVMELFQRALNLLTDAKERKKVAFAHGRLSFSERKDVVDSFSSGSIKLLFASPIFKEGIDVHGISAIVNAGAGKSSVATIQKIGRGLRISKEKEVLYVIDFRDEFHPIFNKHSRKRRNTYRQVGFSVTDV